MRRLLITLFFAIQAITLLAQVGTWRAYMAYHDITDVQKGGNTLYVLASNGLYTYNTTDQSIQTYDRTNGLSDCEIKFIAWCQAAQRLLIAYSNGNFDILDKDGTITNLSDYYNKVTTDDKTLYDVNIDGKYAYVSTGFGILKVNVANASVDETYDLGFRVDYSYLSSNNIYAASSTNGIYTATVSQNLQDPSNWTYHSGYTASTKAIDSDLLAIAQTLNPGGPKLNYCGYLYQYNNKLYTASAQMYAAGCVQIFDGTEWTVYDDSFKNSLGHSYEGTYAVAPDPSDEKHVFAASRTGVQEFQNGTFVTEYSIDNSPLQVAATVGGDNKDYVLVTGLVFDGQGSVWFLNSTSPSTSLLEYKLQEKTWTSHHKEGLFMSDYNRTKENLCKMFMDSKGYMWFVNNYWRHTSFHRYDITNDNLLSFEPSENQDGTSLSISNVRGLAEDKDGNMWIATNIGPLLLYADDIEASTPTYNQVKVPRNDGTDLADYLLSGVDINSVAIDGANRKWFGTNGNGVYLISEDNMEQVQHFTTSNSPLLSDNVLAVAIDGTTGKIYFGTDKGLCSYMSDTTTPSDEMTKANVYAYPNPVPPDYTGTITVVGLSYNADVKIVTANGALVAEGRSNGGSFSWDGRDLKGKRVASGVYMVQTATSDGSKGTVCKIAVVN